MQVVPRSTPTSAPAHSFVNFGHEYISMTNLPLPLIQEAQLSLTGERMYTKYW